MQNTGYIIFIVFTFFTYLVTFHDGFNLIWRAYKFGRLQRLERIRLYIMGIVMPSYMQERFSNFTAYDADIQIRKLYSSTSQDQLTALRHLTVILKMIENDQSNEINGGTKEKIQRALIRLLWHTKTAPDVAKFAKDMLCSHDLVRS